MTNELVEQLRELAYYINGDNESSCSEDDAVLIQKAADKLNGLETECIKLAHLLMSGLVFVHESKITEVDIALAPYLGRSDQCIRPTR